MFYCGIDIAKYKHEASVIDATGVALLDSICMGYPSVSGLRPAGHVVAFMPTRVVGAIWPPVMP